MRPFILLLTLILSAENVAAQSNSTKELSELYSKSAYDKIIQLSTAPGSYDAEALFYLAAAYYAKEDDANSLKYADLSIQKDPTDPQPLALMAAIYASANKPNKALEYYYKLLPLADKKSKEYVGLLFNVGMMEYQLGQYDSASGHYIELLKIAPEDHHANAKLIQVYYAHKQYDKAIPPKKKLYEAHSKGILKDNLKDMFCFDQFKWKDKTIQAFERFQNDEGDNIYRKHIFYVVNKDDDIDYIIQTEYSPIAKEISGNKYVLCTSKGEAHGTYNFYYKADLKYDELKADVIQILEGKAVPVASSSPGK